MASFSSNDVHNAAASIWSTLDRLSEENPEEYKRFINEQLKEGAESLSPPQPAYCLTCSATYKTNPITLLINVCKWDKLPSPKTDDDPIPVKGGVLRHMINPDTRQKFSDTLLYDVAFNPTVVDECTRVTVLQDMLNSLIIDYVTDTVSIRVDRGSIKLARECKGAQNDIEHSLNDRKHLITREAQLDMRDSILDELSKVAEVKDNGVLPPLRPPLQQNKKNLIQEMPDNGEKRSKRKKNKSKLKTPHYTVTSTSTCIEVRVDLPGVDKASEVDIDASEDDVVLNVEGRFHLQVDLPQLVNADEVKAALITNRHTLVVTLPLQSP